MFWTFYILGLILVTVLGSKLISMEDLRTRYWDDPLKVKHVLIGIAVGLIPVINLCVSIMSVIAWIIYFFQSDTFDSMSNTWLDREIFKSKEE